MFLIFDIFPALNKFSKFASHKQISLLHFLFNNYEAEMYVVVVQRQKIPDISMHLFFSTSKISHHLHLKNFSIYSKLTVGYMQHLIIFFIIPVRQLLFTCTYNYTDSCSFNSTRIENM